MMTFRKYITLSLVLLCCVPAFSQKDNRRLIRQGNSLYLDSLFNDAETSYRKAIKKNDKDATAHFNLGNALLRQRNPKDAAAQYESAIKRTKNPLYLAKANHNLGVILQSQKHLLKNQKQNKNQNNQNKQEKDDKKQQNKPQQNKDKQEQKQQQNNNQMSKDNAERLLDAAKQEEQKTQDKLRKGQRFASPRSLDKNW